MTVYVLGAGASVHADYPLASNLGGELRTWACRVYHKSSFLDPDFCDRFLTLERSYGDLNNFESIVTDLYEHPPGSLAAGLLAKYPCLLGDLLDAFRQFFRHVQSFRQSAPLYGRLARQIRPGDTVITFNYDAALERELKRAGLWELGDGYGFELGPNLTPPSKVKVLKLHGSINWYGLIFGGSKGFGSSPSVYGDRPAVVIQDDLHYLGYDCLKDPKSAHLSCMSANSALILPVANKRFYYETAFGKEWERFFNHLWQQAETALKETQEIVIVGYSLPRFDKRARCLLLCSSNLTAAVAVCCAAQTPKIREEFLTHSFRRVDVTYSTFEEWLNRTEGPIG